MKITKTSPLSGLQHTLELPITMEQYNRWIGGDLVQEVFENLTDGQREFLISGITESEWDQYIGSEDDYDDSESNLANGDTLILTNYYEVRLKDIDPDTGSVTQDKRVAVCDNDKDAEILLGILTTHQDNDDPNREFYLLHKVAQ